MISRKEFTVAGATQKHIDMMKGKLRKSDEQECQAASRRTADEGLQLGLDISTAAWVGMINAVPFCAFGVAPVSPISFKGVPWMLGTNEIRRKEATLGVKQVSKYFVAKMLSHFDELENWIDVRNKISIRWLKWCGFILEDPKKYGVEGRPFHRFWMVKEGVSHV